jgi:hypothetical protein
VVWASTTSSGLLRVEPLFVEGLTLMARRNIRVEVPPCAGLGVTESGQELASSGFQH